MMNPVTTAATSTSSEQEARASKEAALEELCDLLGGSRQAQIDEIRRRLEDPILFSKEISQVLAEAVAIRSKQDSKLAAALAPAVSEAIRKSVRRDPRPLVEAIFPVIGPSIRMAIRDAMAGMVESLNRTLDLAMSWHAVKWRIEAFRTGKPFAEVVLIHTIRYRVEQVFLIHSETGLLLQHAQTQAPAVRDSDLISGMLTAIQEFVRDAFNAPEDVGLDEFHAGDLTVCVKRGPLAMVAAVVRGVATQNVRETLQTTIEQIHLSHGEELEQFQGDVAPFESTVSDLEACLLEENLETRKGKTPYLLAACLLVVVVAAAAVVGLRWRQGQRWTNYISELQATPGIVVIAASRQGGRWLVRGMRDPLAADPNRLVLDFGLDPKRIVGQWEPYHALHPPLVLRRVYETIDPPGTVEVTSQNGVLRVTGVAPARWVARAKRVAPAIAGVSNVDFTGMTPAPSLLERATAAIGPPATIRLQLDGRRLIAAGQASHEWIVATRNTLAHMDDLESYDDSAVQDLDLQQALQIKRDLEKMVIGPYASGDSNPSEIDNGQIEAVADTANSLAALTRKLEAGLRIVALGHSDGIGDMENRLRVSRVRAQVVQKHLQSLLPADVKWDVVGVGDSRPAMAERSEADRNMNRRVTFRVELTFKDQTK